MSRGRRGFSLVEAIIALTLSSVVVILVSTVFLVQNQYYAIQLARAAAQDNARMVTERVASDLRSLSFRGIVVAENKRLVVRVPVTSGVVCANLFGGRVAVRIDDLADVETGDIKGVALNDTLYGDWTYQDVSWGSMYLSGGSPAAACAANGADTAGATDDFARFQNFPTYFGVTPFLGAVVMFYDLVEYEFDTSEMDPSTVALFRGPYGGTLSEFATGMDETAQFRYRTGGSTYVTQVPFASLWTIDAVRIEAQARQRPQAGGVDDVTYGWGVNVFLRNTK